MRKRSAIFGSIIAILLGAVSQAAGSGVWQTKTPMETPLMQPSAVVLNGIVYEVGGVTNVGYPTPLPTWTGAYDPGANSWSRKAALHGTAPFPCPSCSLLPPGRAGAGVAVSGGKIYAVGGGTGNGLVPGTEVYDPVLDTWSDKAGMPTLRADLTAQVVNGIIYAIGGNSAARIVISSGVCRISTVT